MNNRLVRIIGGSIFLLTIVFIVIFVNDKNLRKKEDLRLPSRLSSYRDMGYYKINPETILASLERGDANVFTPLLEDPNEIEEVPDISISWTQEDFLKIASALGQFVWNDPLDLKDWNVYDIAFEGSCDGPIGFSFAKITYFKEEIGMYSTRLVEIHPYFGWVSWGDGETYPKPILQKWVGVDLLGSKITADDALRIASDDAKVRLSFESNCGIAMGTPENNDPKNWYLRFIGASDFIAYIVNLETGEYKIRDLGN